MEKRTRKRTRVAGTQAVTIEGKAGADITRHEEEVTHPTYELGCDHPARVRVEGSITQNMGDFNSVRVGVMIEIPCIPTEEAIAETYDIASEWVDDKLSNELDIAVGQ